MRILISTLIAIILTVVITGCTKSPFKEQEPKENAALVYVYVAMYLGVNETERNPYYKIGLNGKSVKGGMVYNEYMAFDLKPETIEVSATRADIEKQHLTLDLKAGDVRYLKIESFSDDFAKFGFQEVRSEVGAKEIAGTVTAVEDRVEEMIDVLITDDEESTKQEEPKTSVAEDKGSTTVPATEKSSADELEHLFELKEKGAITQEEYDALKAKVIN